MGDWQRAHEETLGTKPKRWLQDPRSQQFWLMKDRTFNHRSDGSNYAKGDDWAERVACAVAQHLGLPAAQVELATGGPGTGSPLGVISRTVLDGDESLVHSNELLAEIGAAGISPHDRTGYTLEAVQQVLEPIDPPAGCHEVSAWEVFAGYLDVGAANRNAVRDRINLRVSPPLDRTNSLVHGS
ncbi:MAG: hypothetical protein GY701_03830 [Sulfitobacter sp.]|nr:hypothetical protein [Sulfitobacter sp.]